MTRKEDTTEDGKRVVMYFVNNDLNVSEIISELSALGCDKDGLNKAYKTLTQEDYKIYAYENPDTGDGLFVVDEVALKGIPPLTLMWSVVASHFLGLPTTEAVEHAKHFLDIAKEDVNKQRRHSH